MCSMSVLCPLCAQTSFSSIDALRCSLIKAANGPLACPICHELFLGLDKLTIHLFSHTNIMNVNDDNKNSNVNNLPKIITTTTATKQQSLNSHNNNNNNNINSKINNENIIKENSQMSNAITEVLNRENHLEEVNFENNQQHRIENNLMPTMSQRAPMRKTKLSRADVKKMIQKSQVSLDVRDDPPLTLTNVPVQNAESSVPIATCDICEFTFRNEELRDMHVRLVHQNLVCSKNQIEIPNGSDTTNLAHNTSQTVEPDFKCHLCSKTFKMKGSLRVHLKVVHLMGLPYVNNSPKLSICDRIRHKESSKQLKALNTPTADAILNTPTSNLYNLNPISLIPGLLNGHNPSQNLLNLNVLNIKTTNDFLPENLNNNVVYVLNNCNDQQQITVNQTNDLDTKPTISMSNNLSNNSITENAKIWECDVCSKAFTTKYFLKKHKRLHTGEMPYTCEICARTFTFQQSYHKHLLYHSDEKPHVCSTCGRAFKELSTLHNHERIHSGEKPFKCDVCGKSFRQRVSFLVHTRIHTGVMPYKCDTCQKSFRYKVSQRTHKCQTSTSVEESVECTNMDRISENFIKAFLESSTNSANASTAPAPLSSPTSNEIAAINEKLQPSSTTSTSPPSLLNEQQVLLTKTIDDIVVESCNKLGIGNNESAAGFTPVTNINEGSMSPSQKLQNMRLYSPQMVSPDMNSIEGDLTRFFLDNSNGAQNIL